MSLFSKIVRILDGVVPKRCDYVYLKSDFMYPDNIQAVLDAAIANKIDDKYFFYCDGLGFDSYSETKHIRKVARHSIKALFYFFRSKYVFTDIGVNGLSSPVRNQVLINTWHGTSLKRIGYLMSEKCDCDRPPKASFVVGYSPFFRDVLSSAFGVLPQNVLITGEPRNDYLFSEDDSILRELGLNNGTKLLIWMPTYRQNKCDKTVDGGDYEFGIPLLTKERLSSLEKTCIDNNCTLIIKWHGMQMVDDIKNQKFSNIRFISSDDIQATGKPLYHLVACCDGLITDYSSIYINYLVLNRPICFAYDDMESYMSKRGFMFDDVKSIMPGVHAQSFDSLKRFIEDFSNGKDDYKEQRERINKLLNTYSDNKNAYRLLKAVGLIS